MKLSRATISTPVPGTDQLLLVQPLSGQVALFSGPEAATLRAVEPGADLPASLPLADMHQARFVVEDDQEERSLVADAYADYLGEIEKTPTQLIVVPTFGCNLRCTYCYQEAFDPTASGLIKPETIEALFGYVDRFHGSESPRPYLTIFGGEPLVDTPTHRDRIGRFLDGARARKISVAVVTNGYDLESFIPLLASGPIKEVQVTIDGPESIHDARRPHSTGRGTFSRVVAGIDALVANKLPVNLRVVVDKQNLPALPQLARIAEERGWLELPESHFKTQVGRNYELFGCASRQGRDQLFERAELWAEFASLAEAHPELRRFHQPRLHGMRHLAETGEFPVANFDACPAAKKEWAFGPDGSLYGCTATVGNPKYRLGRYAPTIERDDEAISAWSGRNVFSIKECAACALAPVCGGGCGAVADRQHGSPRAPDCRPVRELFGIGARFYKLGES